MGEITLLQWMKEIIGNISFRIFLWTINKTQDEYFNRFLERIWISNSKKLTVEEESLFEDSIVSAK